MNRLITAVATAALTFALLGATAVAHAELKSSTPAPGSTVTTPPGAVILFTTEDLASGSTGYVTNAGRLVVSTGATISTTTRNQLTIGLRPGLPNGTYTVFWHSVSADDGDVLDASFSFTIAVPTAPAPGAVSNPSTGAKAPSTATAPEADARGLGLALLALASAIALVSARALRRGKARS